MFIIYVNTDVDNYMQSISCCVACLELVDLSAVTTAEIETAELPAAVNHAAAVAITRITELVPLL